MTSKLPSKPWTGRKTKPATVSSYLDRPLHSEAEASAEIKEVQDALSAKWTADRRIRDAAPDLLAALEAMLNEVERAGNAIYDYGWPTVVPQARAAIAKAKGD